LLKQYGLEVEDVWVGRKSYATLEQGQSAGGYLSLLSDNARRNQVAACSSGRKRCRFWILHEELVDTAQEKIAIKLKNCRKNWARPLITTKRPCGHEEFLSNLLYPKNAAIARTSSHICRALGPAWIRRNRAALGYQKAPASHFIIPTRSCAAPPFCRA